MENMPTGAIIGVARLWPIIPRFWQFLSLTFICILIKRKIKAIYCLYNI